MSTWEQRVQRVHEAVDAWSNRLVTPDKPSPRSSLAKDDEAFPAMPCSQLAWFGITVAVEHLDATLRLLAQQVEVGGPLLPSANFTVLRGALVGASQAVVILLPRSRQQRTTHALQLAHEEYRQAYNFRKHLLDHPGLVQVAREASEKADFLVRLDDQRRKAADLLAERGVKSTKLSDTDVVAMAADLVHVSGNDAELLQLALEMEWRLGSGAAHGRLLMALHRVGGHVKEQGVALFGGTYDEIARQICGVSLVLNEAWRMWDLRLV